MTAIAMCDTQADVFYVSDSDDSTLCTYVLICNGSFWASR